MIADSILYLNRLWWGLTRDKQYQARAAEQYEAGASITSMAQVI
jgi:hypothetical protein